MSAEPWKCEGCGWTNIGYVHECDGCGEARLTAVLSRAEAVAEIARYRTSLMAHHEISTLSDDALRESLGGSCQICARAHTPNDLLARVPPDRKGSQ